MKKDSFAMSVLDLFKALSSMESLRKKTVLHSSVLL